MVATDDVRAESRRIQHLAHLQLEADIERRLLEERRGFRFHVCTCDAEFDDEFEADRKFWLDLHLEAARRRGDDFYHQEVPF